MSNYSILNLIQDSFKHFKFYFIILFIAAFTWAAIINIQPILIKEILDNAVISLQTKNFFIIGYWMMWYMVSAFMFILVFRLYDWVTIKWEPNVKKHINLTLFNRLLNHSPSFYQVNFSGSLAAKSDNVVLGTKEIIRIFSDKFLPCMLILLLALCNVSLVNIKFMLAMLTWIVLFMTVSIVFIFKNQHLATKAASARASVIGQVVDVLGSMMTVRLFARQQYEKNFLSNNIDKAISKERARDRFFLKLHAFQGISFWLFQLTCFWWLYQGLKFGSISIGDFMLIVTLNLQVLEHFWNTAQDVREFWEKIGNIKQGLDVIFAPIEITEDKNTKPLVVSRGEILLQNISFSYHNNYNIFSDLSLSIAAGERIGIVGFSGGGKSTLINLILRFFDVQSGKILIDDQDIKQVTLESLYSSIGVITQEPTLFNRSLIDNIRYGNIHATNEEIIEAAKKAHAHDFIMQLPEGYETTIGERGVKISGGQRQRLSIARVFLKKPPIIIMDEATSQLDTVTEGDIQDSLWDIMEEPVYVNGKEVRKTIIVIAHRLSTLAYMDRIIVMAGGKIVEDGTHQELLDKTEGLYKTLWEAQVSGFLPEDV